ALLPMRLAWLDLEGRETGSVPIPPGLYFGPSISPDGRRIGLAMAENYSSGHGSTAVVDIERGIVTRVSDPSTGGGRPVWSPDGSQIAYQPDIAQDIIVQSLGDGT